MKLLLDENLPHKLRTMLPGHDCYTVTYMGWDGIENGALLRMAAAQAFDALISNDKGLEYEQNQARLPLSVIVLITKDNKRATIEALVPALAEVLSHLKPKSFQKLE